MISAFTLGQVSGFGETAFRAENPARLMAARSSTGVALEKSLIMAKEESNDSLEFGLIETEV